jgi:hypothetical protein
MLIFGFTFLSFRFGKTAVKREYSVYVNEQSRNERVSAA